MTSTNFLTRTSVDVATEILAWAETYLATENEKMTRAYGSKVVCPFVRPSLDKECFYIMVHPEINGKDPERIESLMVGYLPQFDIAPPYDPNDKDLKTLLVVFPNIVDDTYVLDNVHKAIKTRFVKRGMMVGQFHKNCQEKSVHNKSFLVSSTSPYPLIAMRYMQQHDILFLHQHFDAPDWFDEYNRRHGHRFRDPNNLHHDVVPFAKLYYEAKERFIP